jgi:undecaprenyl-diphosphatase
MSPVALKRSSASLAPLIVVTCAATVFTVLLVLVRLRWQPLESFDHGSAVRINSLIASHAAVVTVVKAVTSLGSDLVLSAIIGLAVIFLLVRRRWRLALYLIVSSAGALALDPILKALIGRLRPVLAHPIAHGTGNSFPSGHALGSMVCYGAILLVFLPAARGRWRSVFIVGTAVLVALIGISRILLGVHYLSDVVGGWAIGITWLGVTSFAFELTRRAAGKPVTHPVTQGLEPEDRADLRPAQPEAATSDSPPHWRGRIAAGLVIAWVLIVGITVGAGELITKFGNGNELGDRTVPHWLAAHRTPTWTHWSLIFTTVGGTIGILSAALAISVVMLAIRRRWRPVCYIAVLLAGELAAFLTTAAVVRRPRPEVTHLDHHLPTSAYPSGHTAAACCLYIGLAILVIGHARGWWRWLFLIPAITLPVLVAASRIYRGEHHPTDVLGSLLFSALWLTAVTMLTRPNADSGSAAPADSASMHAEHDPVAPTQDASEQPDWRGGSASGCWPGLVVSCPGDVTGGREPWPSGDPRRWRCWIRNSALVATR